MDPDPHGSGLLPGSESGIKVPDPAKSERAYKYNCEFWTVCTIGHCPMDSSNEENGK